MQAHFNNRIQLPNLTPQSAYLGFYNQRKHKIIINQILLIFKITIYHYRERKKCNIRHILKSIDECRRIETDLSYPNPRKIEFNKDKWASIENP